MDDPGAALLIGIAVGAAFGWWSGVRWAERRRAIHDIREYIRKTWEARDQYRRR